MAKTTKKGKAGKAQKVPAPEVQEKKAETAAEKATREAQAVKPIQAAATITGGKEDDGTTVERKDPRVELQREQGRMAMGFEIYEPLLLQTTNFDHPVHATSIIKDMTELDLMRAFGLPESIYKVIKGMGMRSSGFYGFLRARQGILYPPPDGTFVHPRMLLFSSQKIEKELKGSQKDMLTRLLAQGIQ